MRRRDRRLVLLVVLGVWLAGCSGVAQTPTPPVAPSPAAPSPSRLPSPSTPSSTGSGSTTRPSAGPTPSPGGDPARRPVIVVDPGHSGSLIRSTDRQTGLADIDYPNYPEIYEMFDVSVCLAAALRSDGYRVLLTKRRAMSDVGHRARADLANRNGAALAISVHDDHGVGPSFQATYSQRGVPDREGRYPTMYRGVRGHRVVYSRSAVARRSDTAARLIAEARSQAQHRRVSVAQNSFDGRDPLEPGNLALVQLFSRVPWVYNEMGARTGDSTRQAMSIASERDYTAGLLSGVELAVSLPSGTRPASAGSDESLTRCLVRQVEPRPGHFRRPRAYRPAGFAADRENR
jgi:N-acetylmuramoyl-L-alanine amidase